MAFNTSGTKCVIQFRLLFAIVLNSSASVITSPLFGVARPAGQTGTSIFGQSTTQPAGSLFGSTAQPQQSTTSAFGGFGQPQTQAQGTQGTSIFGSATQNSGNQGASLFGTTQPQQGQQQQQQQPAQGTSLFGSTFGQPQQQQPSTSIFGQPAQQQQPTNNIFGQPAQQQQQQQQQKPLFGSSTTNASFGNTMQQPAQQGTGMNPLQPQATQSSLFGSTTGTQTNGSLWGRPVMQQQQ